MGTELHYIIDSLVAVLTPIVSAAGAWWVMKQRSAKALDVCESARAACNDEVHRQKDITDALKTELILTEARIIALEKLLEDHKNAS